VGALHLRFKTDLVSNRITILTAIRLSGHKFSVSVMTLSVYKAINLKCRTIGN
jgi:hypothetical protein